MEFKGTKGEWKLVHSQSKNAWNVVGTVLGGRYKISRSEYIVNTDLSDNINEREKTEQQANALLISKAPEMLNFMQSMVSDYENGIIDDIEDLITKAEQLIKEATELK